MRTFRVDFTQGNPCLDGCYVGRIGEHKATKLVIIPPAEIAENKAVTSYIIAFTTGGMVIHSEPFNKAETLSVPIWRQLTQHSVLGIQLEAYDSAGEYIGKSEYVSGLRFLPSANGNDIPADTDNPDFVSMCLKTKHSHENKHVLDKLSEDENGNLLYDGKSIRGTENDGVDSVIGVRLSSRTYMHDWSDGAVTANSYADGTIDFYVSEYPENGILMDLTVKYEGEELTTTDLVAKGLISNSDCVRVYPIADMRDDMGMYLVAQLVSLGNTGGELINDIIGGVEPISEFTLYYLEGCSGNGTSGENGSGLTDEQATQLADAYALKHEHLNQDTLDKFSENKNGELLHNGKKISDLSAYDIPYTNDIAEEGGIEVKNVGQGLDAFISGFNGIVHEVIIPAVDANTEKSHEHKNKDTLDDIDNIFVKKTDLDSEITTALAEAKASGKFDGADGTSVTVSFVSESTADGGSNVVTFSDGKTLTVKNGSKGSQGEKGDKGDTGEQGIQGVQGVQGEKGDTGATGAAGKDGADGYTPIKGTDYFTEADKAEMIKEVAASLDGVPDYWISHLEQKADEIRQAMEAAGRNKSAFFFYNDAHWWQYKRSEVDDWSKSYTEKREPALLKYLYKNTPINKTNFGGDFIGEEADITTAEGRSVMAYLWEWRKALRDLPNHHSVVGNHDDGNETDKRYSNNFIYTYLLASEECPEIVHGSDFYYYIDDICEQTRYLYLDTAYIGLDDSQINFVKETLLSTPGGWHIVVISHIWHDTNYSTTPATVGDISHYGTTLLAMFDNYNSRVGEYAEGVAQVEFCIGGHTHIDHVDYSAGGIPVILTESSSLSDRSGLACNAGTTTETALSAIVADYDNHIISIIRVGRGENSEVEIKNYVVSYTNWLPRAVDMDGETIFNDMGYATDTRLSGSSGTATATGVCATGFIPCSKGDVVRLANITMDNSSGTGHPNVAVYNELGTSMTLVTNLSGITEGGIWSPVYENGNLIQFTIPNDTKINEGAVYIRICADEITAASVITINEAIE